MLNLTMPALERQPDFYAELPWPPSVNNYWSNGILFPKVEEMKRRISQVGYKDFHKWMRGKSRSMEFLSPKAKRYREAVGWLLVRNKGALTGGRCVVELTLRAPTARHYDVDNFSKAVLDSLQHVGIFDDDKLVDQQLVTKGTPVQGGAVIVRGWKVPEYD